MASNVDPNSLILSILCTSHKRKCIFNFIFESLNWKFSLFSNKEISIRPSWIIRWVFFNQFINELEFCCPKLKMLNQPYSIAPSMIVFGIRDEDFFKKLFFHCVHLWGLNDASSMMPELIVLLMFKSYLVHNWNFINPEIRIFQLINAFSSPMPGSVASWIHSD